MTRPSEPIDLARPTDEKWLSLAIELAVTNVAEGGGPFGALVVATAADVSAASSGEPVALGQNRVTRDLDPSAHAEVTAVRRACREVGDFSLAGYTLYSSCEPCPMCLATALWARLDRVVYAADRDDAARGGFDDRAFYDLFGTGRPTDAWPTRVEGLRVPTAYDPFEAWLANPVRTDY